MTKTLFLFKIEESTLRTYYMIFIYWSSMDILIVSFFGSWEHCFMCVGL